jgi:hypothetical protein
MIFHLSVVFASNPRAYPVYYLLTNIRLRWKQQIAVDETIQKIYILLFLNCKSIEITSKYAWRPPLSSLLECAPALLVEFKGDPGSWSDSLSSV